MLPAAAQSPAGCDDRCRRNAECIGRRHQVRFAGCDKIDQRRQHAGISSAGAQIVRCQPGKREEARTKIGIGDDMAKQLQASHKGVRNVVKTLVAPHVYDTPDASFFN